MVSKTPTRVAAALSGLFLAGWTFQSQAMAETIIDDYWGGTHSASYTDVIGDYRFEIDSVTVTQVGLDLSVVINTNYSGKNVGAGDTFAGALFLGQLGALDYNGGISPTYTNDIYYNPSNLAGSDTDRFSHVLDFDAPPSTGGTGFYVNDAPDTQSGGATLYKITSPNDVVTSNYPSNVANWRQFQPVDITAAAKASANNATGVLGTWATGDGPVNALGDPGYFTFLISDFFKVGNGLGEAGGIYSTGLSLAWAMTCANDVFMAQFTWPKGGITEAPLPAGLVLLLSGLTGLGFIKRFRSKSVA